MLTRLLGLFNIVVAVAVAVNFVATPFYYSGEGDYNVWLVMNWFMLPALLIAVLCSGLSLRGSGGGSCNSNCTLFCASLALTLLFLNNWLTDILSEGGASAEMLQTWAIIDALFPVIVGCSGVTLWRSGSAAAAE